jgi:hypothetical protein
MLCSQIERSLGVKCYWPPKGELACRFIPPGFGTSFIARRVDHLPCIGTGPMGLTPPLFRSPSLGDIAPAIICEPQPGWRTGSRPGTGFMT